MEEEEEAKFHHKRESKCLHQEHKQLLQIPQQMEGKLLMQAQFYVGCKCIPNMHNINFMHGISAPLNTFSCRCATVVMTVYYFLLAE